METLLLHHHHHPCKPTIQNPPTKPSKKPKLQNPKSPNLNLLNPTQISNLIQSCINSQSLSLCHNLHASIKKLPNPPDPFLQTQLVSMYAKIGSLQHAYQVFDEMPQRNLYSYSSIIGACARNKKWVDVVALFYRMMIEGDVVPDDFLFPKILQACANCKDVETGRIIHGMVVKLGGGGEGVGVRVSNSIIGVYAKCGWLSEAKRVFSGMVGRRDRVSWNAVITGCCRVGEIEEGLRLFELMRVEGGIEPDVVTWNVLISRCVQLGRCDYALELMSEMESCGAVPDVFTWTSLISGFVGNNRRLEGLKLFRDMILCGVEPNDVTLMSGVSACASLRDFRKGREVHLVVVKLGYGEDVLVGNALVDMYSKCGKIEYARRVFDVMGKKDVYTWNSMIGGYCQAGYCGIAHDLFTQMQGSDILPNVITWNVLITGYIQNGDEDEAMDLFHRMEKIGGIKRDTASWNSLIAGHLDRGQKDNALGIFRQMQSCGVKPNSVTVLSILPACANLIAIKKLKEIHGCVLRRNLVSELSVANCLIDTYAKSGNIEYSKTIFEGMPSTDIITWNTMTTAYILHGCCNEAIELFERMRKQEYRPNRGTFTSVILAYGAAKMVDEGKSIFHDMSEEYQIVPGLGHYAAMVSLYGRSGKLDEALDLINGMAIEPDVSIWSSLLTACRRHGNVKLAIHAGEKLLELEPDNAFIPRLLVQLYDLCGISKDCSKVKRVGIRRDHNESVGCSWIEDGYKVRSFVSGDFGQMDCRSVRSWIGSLEITTKTSNYHDMLNIEEEEKEEIGGVHSEKLALAFALMKSPPQKVRTIRIVKSPRMCDNCHRFAKLISKTHGCEIYINDSKCLHHFKNGTCSCGDYW